MIDEATKIAQGISDLGMMAYSAAFFLILATTFMITCFKWFKSIINSMIDDSKSCMAELLQETKKQNEQLMDMSEGLRQETQLRIKNTSNTYFDLAAEKVVHMVDQVKRENHISDKEATREKIRNLLSNLHDDRNSRFDSYTYRGKKISLYTNPEWISWVAEVVECEVYSDTVNPDRTSQHVKSIYEKIKLDFYHNLNGQ